MNKSGFTLIELLIATLIASILSTLLFAALYQINRFVPFINRVTDVYEKAALINAQLERDLGGTMVPHEYFVRKNGQQKPEQEPKKESDQKEKKEKEQKESAAVEQTKNKKPLEKIFYSINKDSMLDQLTFITNNPLQIYWGNKSGSAKPRVARVLYKLEEEKKIVAGKKSYNLMRIESPNLEYDAINQPDKNVKSLMVAQGIKSMSVEYTALVEPEEEKNAANKPAAPKKKEIKKSAEWQDKKKEEQKAQEKEKMPLIPALAEITLTLWDPEKKRTTIFPLKIKIPAQVADKEANTSTRLLSGARRLFNENFNNNQRSSFNKAGRP